jgi:hypothetical protein
VAGECFLTVEGFVTDSNGREAVRCVTEEARFRVLPSKLYTNDTDPVTPDQAEQLQAEIDSIKETIVEAGNSQRAAKASEEAAAAAAQNAAESEESAAKAAQNAAESEESAKEAASAAEAAQSGAERAQAAAEAAKENLETAVDSASRSAQAASESEGEAAQSAAAAAESAQSAAASAQTADTSARTAVQAAQAAITAAEATADAQETVAASAEAAAKSEAQAAYWADQAAEVAGGDFATNTSVEKAVSGHDASETAHEDIRKAVAEAAEVAKGRATGYVFDTVEDMETWLADSGNTGKLNLGDNLYIRATDVPDYWWDGEQAQQLETQKVDLSDYVKNDQYATGTAMGLIRSGNGLGTSNGNGQTLSVTVDLQI